ncbi:MAG: hypothetical protein IAE96_13120 [Chitinophagaceae bacterium]|nr:hypothetical protein [Chitinophagaceae bacterium]
MRNYYFQFLLVCTSITLLSYCSISVGKQISRIVVYKVAKGKERFIGVTEVNIKLNSTAEIIEIKDSLCLEEIKKRIESLKKLKGTHAMRSIYMLCDITYKDGSIQTISFEEANLGVIKMGNKIYSNSPSLESWLLFCK